MGWRRRFESLIFLLLWAALVCGPARALTMTENAVPLSRDYLMAKGRMDASGRVMRPCLGTQRTFWVRVPNDTFGLVYQYAQRSATLRRTGAHSYLYVEDGVQLSDSVINDLGTTYDSLIYPTCQRSFGHEWNPGIDGDSLVTIFLGSDLLSEFYFSPYDETPDSLAREKGHRSNEREMFYLGRATYSPERVKAAIAHCQEHLIHWWQNPPGEAWLDEACAMVAMDLCGFGSTIREVDDFRGNAALALTDWPSKLVDLPAAPDEPLNAKRGMLYSFLAYLVEKYPGNDSLLYHLVARRDLNPSFPWFFPNGIANVTKAFQETEGRYLNFIELFVRWNAANFVNDTTVVDPTPGYAPIGFGYRKPLGGMARFQVLPTTGPPYYFQTFPDSVFLELPWYGQEYIEIPVTRPSLRVELDQDLGMWIGFGEECYGWLYQGYVITSTSEDFALGTNTIRRMVTPPLFRVPVIKGETLQVSSDIKKIRVISSMQWATSFEGWVGESPKFYVFAYTPISPQDSGSKVYVFPNPFNPDKEKVHFRYVVTAPSKVDIRVYDASGNQVAIVADEQWQTTPAIYNSQTWDGRNYRGKPVANGVYFGRIKVGDKTTGVKIAVMR